ncbi:ANTAR domain-containing protein [Amycolatopsis minnesotensis]|uniref:GAF and ANTAR domain-containing protein n=1 Tax=Amycolatopsis minnesotensis TaxID=337894 RepID=A0ABN2QMD6_9PSEU
MTVNNREERAEIGPALLERLLRQVERTVPGFLGASLNATAPDGRRLAAIGLGAELDALQKETGEGPTLYAAAEQEAVTSDDVTADDRWPTLAGKVAGREGTLAVVSVAGSWDDEGPIVLTLYLDHPPAPDDLRRVEEIEPVLAMSAALVDYCADETLRGDQLLKMVENRRVIEQAKGMIMAVRQCDAGTAFSSLIAASQHFNVKLRDLAVAAVEHVGQAPAEAEPEEVLGYGHDHAPASDAARRAAELMWAALRS